MSVFKKYSNYEQNHGVSGVVYILTNPGLREGFLKIGCSRYSGKKRAEDLGMKVVGAISKKTDFVVFGSEAGTKLKKAHELNLKILNEEEWLKLIS